MALTRWRDRVALEGLTIVSGDAMLIILGIIFPILKEKKIFGLQSTFFFTPPDSTGASKHQDSLYVQPEDSEGFITSWLSLVDLYENNMGNLVVYPESHKNGRLEIKERKDIKKYKAFAEVENLKISILFPEQNNYLSASLLGSNCPISPYSDGSLFISCLRYSSASAAEATISS